MFYIIKKGTSNFWHRFNNDSKEVNISKWEVVLDNVNQTISLQMPNGSNIPANEVGILDVIVIDETGANVNETFANVLSLRVRLVSLGYNPYDSSGGGSGGATTFLGLSDVPSSYSGEGGKIVKVKATEDGLEFVTESAGSLISVTGPTVDNTDPANPIVNVPSLQQVTSALVDADGYAETTDGIKAPKLKVSQFGADENGFYLLSDYEDGLKTIVADSGGVLSVVDAFGLNAATNMTSSGFQVVDNENLKASYLAVEKIQYSDLSTNKNIAFLFPTSIVGTNKIVQWRDLSGTPALLSDIPTADDLGAEKLVNKGVANGYVPLDSGVKIDTIYLPDSVLGQMVYGGLFNGNTAVATLTTNAKTRLGTTDATITLTNDTTAITGYLANEGIYYISSVAGTFAGLSIDVGDWLLSIGTGWAKIDNTDAISSFNGRTGAIVLIASDVADLVHAATSKTTIVDADEICGTNSATSFSLIRITALNLYNYIKGKFDLVYTTTSAVATQITTALASFKTTNFLDFTSSGQSQIDGKLSESDVNIFCDFNSATSTSQFVFYENFFNSKNGSGFATTATNAPIVDTSNMGVWYLKAGVGANNYNIIGSGDVNSTLNQIALSSNISSYETFVYLDNLTDSSLFISGFINQALNTAQTNGCYFAYNPTANSGRIQCITVNSGTATTTSLTGITVTSKWFKFKVVATSTSVLYYVDGSLVATHTTNIPTARMGYGFGINNNTNGPTTVGIYADYFRAKFKNLR